MRLRTEHRWLCTLGFFLVMEAALHALTGVACVWRRSFCDAMFEIADLYTESSTRDEYSDFLTRLLSLCLQQAREPAGKHSTAAEAGVFWQCSDAAKQARF